MKRLKIQFNGLKKCPSCKDPGIVWQPYGMKCAFCGYCQYFKRSNKACSGFAAGRVKNKGSAKAANR
jgi:hypothetical protein